MKLKTKEEYTKYLKQIVQMEFAVYKLEELKNRIEDELFNHRQRTNIVIDHIREEEPVFKFPEFTEQEPIKPDDLPEKIFNEGIFKFSLASFWVVFLLVFTVLALCFKNLGKFEIFIISSVFATGIAIAVYKKINKEYRLSLIRKHDEEIKEYEDNLMDYNYLLNEHEEKKKAAKEEFKRKKEEYDKQILVIRNYSEMKIDVIRGQLSRIDEQLVYASNFLYRLYAMDIIYPKYRKLIPMCSIYEYFDSGRVDTLEGTNGAYNLYETEFRSNRIIVSLDEILNDRNQIIDTQFTLYQNLTLIEVDIDLTVGLIYEFLTENTQETLVLDLKRIIAHIAEASAFINVHNQTKNLGNRKSRK